MMALLILVGESGVTRRPKRGNKSPVARVPSMPRAATAIPYMEAREKLTKMTMASAMVGMMVDW